MSEETAILKARASWLRSNAVTIVGWLLIILGGAVAFGEAKADAHYLVDRVAKIGDELKVHQSLNAHPGADKRLSLIEGNQGAIQRLDSKLDSLMDRLARIEGKLSATDHNHR